MQQCLAIKRDELAILARQSPWFPASENLEETLHCSCTLGGHAVRPSPPPCHSTRLAIDPTTNSAAMLASQPYLQDPVAR